MSVLKPWKTLHSEWVIHHQWCAVRKDTVQLGSGKVIDDYFINVRPDIALILPLTATQDVIFVRQYRHGIQQIVMELPAGRFDPNTEESLEAAKRELEEETGYISPDWVKLATLHDNPVKDTNTIHIFLAQNAELLGTQNLDETEELEVLLIPLDQVWEKIKQRELCISGSITAFFLGLQYLKKF